jgi:hypothetical protein
MAWCLINQAQGQLYFFILSMCEGFGQAVCVFMMRGADEGKLTVVLISADRSATLPLGKIGPIPLPL